MKQLRWLFALCLATGALASPQSGLTVRTVSVGRGLDTGLDAIGAANLGKLPGSDGRSGWLRLRGLGRPGERTQETRTALRKLRADGWLLCVLLHCPADGQTVASTGGNNGVIGLPVDLRTAFENSRRLSALYGDLIDAWEVENEPDLGFVPALPENYAAYLKASYLGFKSGSKALGAGSSSVLMGALGLPPGPWLERFAANDGMGYTDGFSYHYYGYAEDFTGVYQQHERAVAELTTHGIESSHSTDTATSLLKKDWPVFLTETGYGMLGKMAMNTKEGRLRQWRWFKSTGGLSDDLGISGTMAFLLRPYLERDTLEFGLTVPGSAAQTTEDRGQKTVHKTGGWMAGGVDYVPEDFGTKRSEPWMELIGQGNGGNEVTPALAWWLAGRRSEQMPGFEQGATALASQVRSKEQGAGSRSWAVCTPAPSSIVIDFVAGDGLLPVKRFNGSFVKDPQPGLKSVTPPKGPGAYRQPPGGEFMIHVRTANGNLYEVYPTRMATPDWQHYLEQQANFTMSFYGRAELPWRFKDNRPVSLVVVMYPKQLPVTYEFKRVQLIRLGEAGHEKAQEDTKRPALYRYGQGKVVLYNFSDNVVTGKLWLPAGLTTEKAEDTEMMTLTPNERREVSVVILVGATRFERNQAVITFVPADGEIPPARYVTEFFPALEGLKTCIVAQLLSQGTEDRGQKTEDSKISKGLRSKVSGLSNREIISNRQLATEEARGRLQPDTGFIAQQGAKIDRTSEGFMVTVTKTPPGKEQRVEVEIPWPDGLEFKPEEFLSLEFRLRPER